MKIQQLSVFVSNQPGRLHSVCRTLAEAGINLLSITLADSDDFGLIRLIVSDSDKAVEVLEKSGIASTITEVIACKVSAKRGGLADLLATPAGELQIEYMYAFPACRDPDYAIMIFRFHDPDKAVELLQQSGVSLVSRREILNTGCGN
ncbi:MAG: ACT domain-containing protein [Fibrobacter sp.]|jgi:hypothetical protein|nr:ACT domain-containing protein [Fibrobacter sp.]